MRSCSLTAVLLLNMMHRTGEEIVVLMSCTVVCDFRVAVGSAPRNMQDPKCQVL